MLPCCSRGDTCLTDSICEYSHSTQGGIYCATYNVFLAQKVIPQSPHRLRLRWRCMEMLWWNVRKTRLSESIIKRQLSRRLLRWAHRILVCWVIGSHSFQFTPTYIVNILFEFRNCYCRKPWPVLCSTGGKAGISVSPAVGGILPVAGAFFLIRQRRQKHAQVMPVTEGALLSQSVVARPPPQELSATHKRLSAQELEWSVDFEPSSHWVTWANMWNQAKRLYMVLEARHSGLRQAMDGSERLFVHQY